MKAVVVQNFEAPPTLAEFDPPVVAEEEILVRVEAAALSQLARGQASGRHYSSGVPPFVPGADGVGRTEDGRRVYFAFPRAPWGSMGEFTTVDRRYVVPLPEHVDSVAFAALANPAMSSWAALTKRAEFRRGESVLVNGANSASGRLAIRISRILGAGRVVATARNEAARAELLALGADAFISLNQPPEQVASEVSREMAEGIDVVLDYLWGPPAKWVLDGIASCAKSFGARRVRFVNIGELAGATMTLTSHPLRSTQVELIGSGIGSLPKQSLVDSVAEVVAAMKYEPLEMSALVVPIHEVSKHWVSDTKSRLVFML
jgi:NADPH:quinone reductase-like Zn-dependent oxidoreductase